MKLKNLDEIKKDGLVVFMPSGIQATLFRENSQIIVKYYNLKEDKYSENDFKKLIDEGIVIFNDRPTTQVMESASESVLNKLSRMGYIRESLSNQYHENNFQLYDQSYYVLGIDGEQEGPFDSYEEANEYIKTTTGDDEQLMADYSIVRSEELETYSEITENEDTEEFYVVNGQEIIAGPFDTDKDADAYICLETKTGNEETNNWSIVTQFDLDEAYNQEDNKPGSVYTALKDKNLEYITPEFKIELLQNLDIICKEFPNIKIRQQAQTFIDELGLQEYPNIKIIKDFINKNIKILKEKPITNESIQEDLNLDALKNISKEIYKGNKQGYEPTYYGNWIIETSLDKKWEKLTKNAQNFILSTISDEIYVGKIEATDLAIPINYYLNLHKSDIESFNILNIDELDKIGTENINIYISFKLNFDKKLGESFKVKSKKKKKQKLSELDKRNHSIKEDNYLKDNKENSTQVYHIIDTFTKPHKDLGVKTIKELKHLADTLALDIAKTDNDYTNDYNLPNFDIHNPKEIIKYLQDVGAYKIYIENSNNSTNMKDKEEYLKLQKEYNKDTDYEEVIKEAMSKKNAKNKVKTKNCRKVNEDQYKVFNSITSTDVGKFNNWEEVMNFLNKEWGEYKADRAKENNEFGSQDDYNNFLQNYSIELEPISVPVDEIPAEGIDLPITDIVSVEEDVEEDIEDNNEDNLKSEPIENEIEINDDAAESDENEVENAENDDEPKEIDNAEDAKELIDKIEDSLDSLEDYIKDLIGDEDEDLFIDDEDALLAQPKEEETIKATNEDSNQDNDELRFEIRIQKPNGETEVRKYKNIVKAAEYYRKIRKDIIRSLVDTKTNEILISHEQDEELDEEFKDGMSGMLTDINDLDFPDALQKVVDTKDDGSLYRISDIAKEVEELKGSIAQMKNDFKSDMTNLIQDLKNELKISVNDVENKVQDTKNAVDNLTSEEEELEAEETNSTEEEPIETETSDETNPPAEDEEKYEESLKNNKIFSCIKEIMQENDHPKKLISLNTIAEQLTQKYGINADVRTTGGKIMFEQMAEMINNTSLKNKIIDAMTEKTLKKEQILGKAKNWLGEGLLGHLANLKEKQKLENLQNIKTEIDKKIRDGSSAQEIKDVITLTADNEQEEKQAQDYAIEKMDKKVENLKKQLLHTSKTSKINNLFS